MAKAGSITEFIRPLVGGTSFPGIEPRLWKLRNCKSSIDHACIILDLSKTDRAASS